MLLSFQIEYSTIVSNPQYFVKVDGTADFRAEKLAFFNFSSRTRYFIHEFLFHSFARSFVRSFVCLFVRFSGSLPLMPIFALLLLVYV